MMHKYFTLYLLVALPVGATVYNTSSTPTAAEVQALHDGASAGDTIKIPDGSFDWSDKVTITKGVNIKGSGPGITTLTRSGGGTLFLMRSSDATVGFFKAAMAANEVRVINFNGLTSNLSGVRITNIHFDHSLYTGRDIFKNDNQPYNVACLVDNCRFDWGQSADEPIFMHGPNTAWEFAAPFGSGDVFIMEDCRINDGGGYPDFNNYATAVVRYCTIENNKLDWHGAASNSVRGCRSSEIYGNVWTSSGSGVRIEVRGGSSIIWGNHHGHDAGGSMLIRDYGITYARWPAFQADYTGVSDNGGNAQFTGLPADWVADNIKVGKSLAHIGAPDPANYPNWNYGDYLVTAKGTTDFAVDIAFAGTDSGTFGQVQTPDSRPIRDQVGVGVNQVSGEEPAYVVGNRRPADEQWLWEPKTASAHGIDLYGASYNDKDIIVPDTDIFEEVAGFDGTAGCGIGTKAEMEAITPTKTGVGFWVTDEGSWHADKPGTSGQLYRWTGTEWELHYTPYQYPHPLNDGVSEFPPTAPMSLSISAK